MSDLLPTQPVPLSLVFTGVDGTSWMYCPRRAVGGGQNQDARGAFEELGVAERGALVALAREIVATFGSDA